MRIARARGFGSCLIHLSAKGSRSGQDGYMSMRNMAVVGVCLAIVLVFVFSTLINLPR